MAERGGDMVESRADVVEIGGGIFYRIVDYGSSDDEGSAPQPSVKFGKRKLELLDGPAENQLGSAAPRLIADGASSSRTGSYSDFREEVLRTMGYSDRRIWEAKESCGDEASVENLIAFLVATQELSFSEKLGTMGYSKDVVEQALKICGDKDLTVLVDFIDAHLAPEEPSLVGNPQAPEAEDVEISPDGEESEEENMDWEMRATEEAERRFSRGEMTGFGVPGVPTVSRQLTPAQSQRPFFYFENVSCMPAGEWDEIVRCLDHIEPEFVCARHFSVARRARGYVHNLPIRGRSLLLPVPPKTIWDFFPHSRPFIPPWDDRTQLSCINTRRSAATYCKKIRDQLRHGEPPEAVKREIMFNCRKWNLIWTGPGICSPLEEHEVEAVMGYPKNHTRDAISRTDQMKSLGNSFQIDTVGYHLSALRQLFPDGIRVLSLFSGIGGAEVALHRAGVPLRFVVSVEAEQCNRWILQKWWTTSGQRGTHRILPDVQALNRDTLEVLIVEAGGFDLIIGGSPCNNLSGNNRSSRTGLKGEKSKLFYEFPRILKLVREIMQQQQRVLPVQLKVPIVLLGLRKSRKVVAKSKTSGNEFEDITR